MALILEPPRDELIARPTPEQIRLVAAPLPIPVATVNRVMPAGQTLTELLAQIRVPIGMLPTIAIDGHEIARAYWPHVRPKPGRTVTIRAVPMMTGGGAGGGGGDSNKALRTALLVVVAIAAMAVTYFVPVLAPAAWGGWAVLLGGVAGAAVAIGGSLAVNALLPVQTPKASRTEAFDNVWGITGARNALAALGMPLPRSYGRHKIYPQYGAEPYTEVIGGQQYLRMAFCLGYGPQAISEPKIGETAVGNYQGVEIEYRHGWPDDPPLTLFSNDVAEDAESVRLVYGTPAVRVTRQAADELSIDLAMPDGLWATKSQGPDLEIVYSSFYIQYRRIGGSGEWELAPGRAAPHPAFLEYVFVEDPGGFNRLVSRPIGETPTPGLIEFREATRSPILFGWSWPVAVRGDYEILITKLQADRVDSRGSDRAFWTAIRAIKHEDPMPRTGVAKIALRIKGSEQLNGIVDTFNVIVESVLRDWNGSAWVQQITSNPASVYRDILQGSASAHPVPDTRVDLAALQAWHQECAAAGFQYNAVIDGRTTAFEMLREVAACGRASFSMGAFGKYSVVRDLPQTVPVAHVTPRNSWEYSGRRMFPDVPHALKVRWIDPGSDWQAVELVVYDDGYTAATATRFETVEYRGLTNAAQAFKIGRYLIAVARLRPEVHEVAMDFEHVVFTRGDLVRLSHDVISAGLAVGRIKSVDVDGSDNALSITADEVFTHPDVVGPIPYGVKIRNAHGVEVAAQVHAMPGASNTLSFVTPIPAAIRPRPGELVMHGELGRETIDVICHAIMSSKDLTARCAFVPAAPAVHLADQAAIPPWTPQITKVHITQRLPPKPIIDSVRSDENVLVMAADGSVTSRILLAIRYASATGAPSIDMLQVQYKRSDSTIWQTLQSPVSGAATQVGVAPVEDGVAYDIRLRSVSGLPAPGLVSEWVAVFGHVVVGKTTPPPDVPTLTLEGTRLRWPYPAPPPDLAGFQIRRHFGDRDVWSDAQRIADLAATPGFTVFEYPIPLERLSVVTYLIKAIDRGGHLSVNAATLMVDLGGPELGTALRVIDFRALGFPGTHDGLIVTGDLVANSSTLFWGPDDAPFWSTAAGAPQHGVQSMFYFWLGGVGTAVTSGAGGDLFWHPDAFRSLTYRFSILPLPHEVEADLVLRADIAARSLAVEYQLTGTTLFWKGDAEPFWGADAALFWGDSPPGDTWLPFNGRISNITRQVYEFRILASGYDLQSKVAGLVATVDAGAIDEFIDDLPVPITGEIRLPLTKRFHAIKTVLPSLNADGGSAAIVRVVDKGQGAPFLTLGPLVRTYTVGEALTSANIDVGIRGY